MDHTVKTISCDNGTEFKNRIINEFCEMKGIRREFSVARTPQQNGRKPALSFVKPFGYPVTILNTLDHLGPKSSNDEVADDAEKKNYALWKVIINSDSPVPEPPAVGTVVPLKTKAQKLAWKNKLKAKSTLLLAFPDEHLLKFHSIKDAKSFFKAIKIRFERNKKSKKIHKAILKQQYENFVSSRSKGLDKTYDRFQKLISQLELNGGHDYNKGKKFMKKTERNLNFNGKEPVGFDKTRVECFNCHSRGHFAREFHAPRNQGNRSGDNEKRVVLVETPTSVLVVQDGLGGYDWIRDISIKDLKNQLEKDIKKDDLKEKLTKFEESSKNLTKLISSQMNVNDKTGMGYDSQLSKNEMPKCKIYKSASDSSVSEIDEDNNQAKDRYQVGIGYHAVLPPYIRNYMPQRADLSFTGLDDSVFKFKISETRTSVNENE
nr:ribonuclease H-like domain-containing protein [Tanacetum cinerariifolium]